IRDRNVTGVQTCALPISRVLSQNQLVVGKIEEGRVVVSERPGPLVHIAHSKVEREARRGLPSVLNVPFPIATQEVRLHVNSIACVYRKAEQEVSQTVAWGLRKPRPTPVARPLPAKTEIAQRWPAAKPANAFLLVSAFLEARL